MNAGMVGTLLSLAATLGAAWLLTYAVHSTALIGSVWLAERAGLLRSLRLRDLAWRTALVGGLFTATLQLAAGLTPFGGAAELRTPALPDVSRTTPSAPSEAGQIAIVSRGPRVHPQAGPRTHAPHAAASADAMPAVPAVPAAPSVATAPVSAMVPVPSPALPVPPQTLAVPRLSPAGLAFLGWAVVASAFLLRLAVLRARLLTALGERAPVLDPLVRARLEGLCRDVGHDREIRLTTADGLRSPVALGWTEICLPAQALLELDAAQQRSVLAHELAHLRRLDPVWLVVGSVLEQLFFFQPLNRLARARMQEVAEFLCDDWAAARNGSGLDVARGLASVAAWLDGRATTLPLAGMAEHPSQLLARVTRLLDRSAEEVERLRPWHVGGMALLLLLTVFIAPGVRAAPEQGTVERKKVQLAVQSLDREVLEGNGDDSAGGGSTRDSGASPAAPRPDPARAPAPSPAPDAAPPPSTESAPPTHRRAPAPNPTRALRLVAPVASTPVVASVSSVPMVPPVSMVAFAAPVPPTPPRAPMAPLPPSVPTPAEMEQIRRNAERMARDAERRARDATAHYKYKARKGKGRHGKDGTPADPKTVDALIGALKDADPGVRQAAAESLGRIGDPRSVDPLSGLLNDGNAEVKRSAIEALGNIGDAKAIPALSRAAGDANPAVRREAAEALLSFDEPAAGEPLIKLLGDSDARVRLTAMEGLSARGDKRALGPLSKLVKDPNVEIRARAVRALSRYRDPAAQEGLVSALKDENAEVRAAAAAGLGQLELKAAPQGLIDATRDPSADVRQQAAEALGQIRDAKSVPQLKALLEDGDADVRGSAVEALSEIRDGAALQALIAAMQSKDVTVRRAAAQALGQRD
ncbi:MAG TPA: M56 family metallopeptidase [Myxococcaceae bacterium]|jgi:HEAT repeat protein/beta-lactamase regulating signal transducer with metallopeptidase domain